VVNPIVFGENLASAIFAFNRLKAGLDVSIGADHDLSTKFAGVQFGSQTVDRGMVLIEPQRSNYPKFDISKYSGECRANALPFLGTVSEWFQKCNLTLDQAQISMLFRGMLLKDFFIADSLNVMHQFSGQEQKSIRNELESSIKKLDKNNHPRKKYHNKWYEENRYLEISRLLHGSTLTEVLLSPYLYKVYGMDAEKLVASEHRSAWAPFYFPESILGCLNGEETGIEEKTFVYPSRIGFSEFISQMELYVNKNVSRNAISFENLESGLSKPDQENKVVAYFESPKKLNQMETFDTQYIKGRCIYIKAYAPITKTVFIVDLEWHAFRLNLRNGESATDGYVCVEFGVAASHQSNENLIQESLKLCRFFEVEVESRSAMVFECRYPLRTRQSEGLFENMHNAIRILRDRGMYGYPIFELNGSINDQICAANATYSEIERLD
jgi:hypothetical protein